MNQQTCNNSQY